MHTIIAYIANGPTQTYITGFELNGRFYGKNDQIHYDAFTIILLDRLGGLNVSNIKFINNLAKHFIEQKKLSKFKRSVIQTSNLISEFKYAKFEIQADPSPVSGQNLNSTTDKITLNSICAEKFEIDTIIHSFFPKYKK